MSSTLPTTEGPIFMNLGGRNRNMITEPFEEDEPEFPQYGEFKRQIEQMINTKTQSNMFRPEPHNKEIGSSAEEQELTRRFLRTDTNGNPDNTRPPCTPQDTKNYHNMVREQANQALADTIACDLYVSVLGRYRKAQMQTLIDDTETSARTRLTKIKTAHWRQVLDHVQIIISNYKQQWYKGQVPSQNLKSAMFNLNILQEINKQVNNFDPRQTFSGLDIATMMLPTLVGTEFNQMVREWKRDIRKNTQIDITEISDDIQNCFSIQNSVTNPDTYSFIINPKETNRTQIKDTYTEDRHRGRNNSNTRHQRQYNESDIQDIRDRAYREGKASNDERNNRSRSRDSPRTRQNSYAANREPTDQRQAPPNRNKLQKESPPESSTETTTNIKQQPKPLSAPKKKRKRPTSKPHAQTSILKQTTNIQQQQQTTTTKHNHTPNTEQNTHNNNAETQQQSIFTKERIMKVTTDTAIADSGTDIHITNTDTIKRMNLPTYTYENPISIKFGQGAVQTAYTYTWMGDILEEVAIIPNAPATLISMYAIATKGLTVSLNATRITITDEFTGNTVYNRYVDRPGLYFIDLNKFITIKAPKHLEQYKRMSAHAKRIQKVTINEEEEQDNTDERDNQKQHHTCLLATTQQEPPLSDITPSQKRATNQRIPTSVIKRILWLHKSTGHRGREALAQMVQSMTNAGEGVTADTVRRVYDHIQCTACELAKRNKASTQKGSGIHNNNPGHTISIDYIGKITPTSARGHTGQFIAEDRATNYLHEHPTKSKDADNLIQFLTNVLAFYRHNKWEVREIRTDKGSVEISEQVKQFLNKQQPPIVVISAAPRQQQQNPWERTAQTMIKGTGAVMTDQYTF